jgi:hypothetical protein
MKINDQNLLKKTENHQTIVVWWCSNTVLCIVASRYLLQLIRISLGTMFDDKIQKWRGTADDCIQYGTRTASSDPCKIRRCARTTAAVLDYGSAGAPEIALPRQRQAQPFPNSSFGSCVQFEAHFLFNNLADSTRKNPMNNPAPPSIVVDSCRRLVNRLTPHVAGASFLGIARVSPALGIHRDFRFRNISRNAHAATVSPTVELSPSCGQRC